VIIVVVSLSFSLPGVSSLKEKRRRVKSLITRVRNKFNVSISEVADNDSHRVATIGAAIVTNDTAFGHQVASQVIRMAESEPEMLLTDCKTETL
jgi:uncharacterized protein YlxP (DUF503 family)